MRQNRGINTELLFAVVAFLQCVIPCAYHQLHLFYYCNLSFVRHYCYHDTNGSGRNRLSCTKHGERLV